MPPLRLLPERSRVCSEARDERDAGMLPRRPEEGREMAMAATEGSEEREGLVARDGEEQSRRVELVVKVHWRLDQEQRGVELDQVEREEGVAPLERVDLICRRRVTSWLSDKARGLLRRKKKRRRREAMAVAMVVVVVAALVVMAAADMERSGASSE